MSIADEVILIVADVAGVDAASIGADTQLWRDLRIGGDDMLELFLTLQKKYDIDLNGLHLPTYSPNEDEFLIETFVEWVRKRLRLSRSSRYKSLTVADLIAVVEAKSWAHRS